MAVWLLGESLALVLLGVPAPVPDLAPSAPMASAFDLGARTAVPVPLLAAPSGDERAIRLQPVTADDGWTPPLRSWGHAGNGPVIELGTLGSSKIRKRRADLVHLSLDWGF